MTERVFCWEKKMKKFFLLSVFFSVAVNAQTGAFEDKINRLENDVLLMQRKLYAGTQDAHDTSLIEDVYTKLESQEGLIQELTAQLEKVNYENQKLKEDFSRMSADINMRFKMMEEQKNSSKNQEENTDTKKDLTGKKVYDEAYTALKEGKYKEAEDIFRTFIEKYPEDKLVGNANYWLGETYYAQGLYSEAIGFFAKGISVYKDNIKAPDNLLKLGLCMEKLGKKDEACGAFKNLSVEFPKASDEIKEKAKKEAERLGC